jgi:hypothetical protein
MWDVHAGCLMATHYHLLIGPRLDGSRTG